MCTGQSHLLLQNPTYHYPRWVGMLGPQVFSYFKWAWIYQLVKHVAYAIMQALCPIEKGPAVLRTLFYRCMFIQAVATHCKCVSVCKCKCLHFSQVCVGCGMCVQCRYAVVSVSVCAVVMCTVLVGLYGCVWSCVGREYVCLWCAFLICICWVCAQHLTLVGELARP